MQDFQDQIPYYLTEEQGKGLLRELKSYSPDTSMFLFKETDGVLQGDGWSGFRIANFETESFRDVRGMVLSNSCDIDLENARDIPAKVTFAPIFKLSKLEKVLQGAGLSSQSIANKIMAIRQQKNSQFFFLPAQGVLDEDYVVWFSDLHSMPMESFLKSDGKKKIFTLNMVGFYYCLFKLSIHFCRFHEQVDRFDAPAEPR